MKIVTLYGVAEVLDAIKRSKEVEKIVCRNLERKYRRFRSARFYGGVTTADCIGCNVSCKFCWSWNTVVYPEKYGDFYSPQQVANNLVAIARKAGFTQVRISGNEPTIGREHLIEVLRLIPSDLHFILETNGLLIGADASFARDLAAFDNLHVRVCLKGASEQEFERLTGARGDQFKFQLDALKNLIDARVSCHAAVMASFSSRENLDSLRKRLKEIDSRLAGSIELEEVVDYGGAFTRLKKACLL